MRKKYIKVPEMSKVLKLKSGATFRQENVSLKRDFISCRMIKTDHMRSRNKKVKTYIGGQMKQKLEEVTMVNGILLHKLF